MFTEFDIHVHVPSGAVSKDGPSAGMALVISLLSCLTKKEVNQHIAMTGEIDLQGNILPVGGIKEKVLAAQRNNITTVLIPEANRPDVIEIGTLMDSFSVIYISNIMDGVTAALASVEEKEQTPAPVPEENNITEGLLTELPEEQFAL